MMRERRHRMWTLPLASLLAWGASPVGAVSPLGDFQEAFVALARRAKPAVVNITAIHEQQVYVQTPNFFFGDPEEVFNEMMQGGRPGVRSYRWRTHGTGSGAVIDPRGYVLTNEHVIRGADQIQVRLTEPDGRQHTIPGRVVGRDANLDLAVVKIQAAGTYPFLTLADSSKIRVGEWAVAIGSPFELEQTVTAGIISAVRQTLMIEGRRYDNLLQTDAAINQGNSGGPLLNISGELIGINTAIFSPSGASAGIGFAIPANAAKEVLDDLIAGRKIQRGWLGVEAVPVNEVIRRQFGLKDAEGALVNSVVGKSPATAAGLKRGDVILRFNGDPVRNPVDLAHAVGRGAAGKAATLEIDRRGRRLELRATLGLRPETEDEAAGGPPGSEREPAPPPKEDSLQWEGVALAQSREGVVVQRVDRDSKLYGYFLERDVIRGVNQTEVSSLEDFKRLSAGVRLSEGIVFDILRQGQPMYISVQLND